MPRHPDVPLGSVGEPRYGTIDVLVSGVEVVLTLTDGVGVSHRLDLSPDQVVELRDLLTRALEV